MTKKRGISHFVLWILSFLRHSSLGIRHFFAVALRSWFAPKSLGERGELAAARFLRRLGYRIVTTRLRRRYGEVDIIALDGQTVTFVEVKTRRLDLTTQPAEAVDLKRQQRLTRAALAFLKGHGLLEYPSRFDVIEVIWPEGEKHPTIRHIINAFPAAGRGQMYS
jgi:putative endonuclease